MREPTTVQEAVANGAQLLDEQLPGWHKKINLDKLDVSDGWYCVCGQLDGNEEWDDFAKREFNVPLREAGLYGFTHYLHDERPGSSWPLTRYLGWSYEQLTGEWKTAIRTRLALDEMPVVEREREEVTV